MVDIDAVERRFESLLPAVDERMRRLIAAAESLAIDYGGISIVSRATGVSRRAIARGIVELGNPPVPSGRGIRKRIHARIHSGSNSRYRRRQMA
jgi:DNA-binding phage protein